MKLFVLNFVILKNDMCCFGIYEVVLIINKWEKMKKVSIRDVKETLENPTAPSFAKDYIWAPIRFGSFGFVIFFTILLAVKLFGYIIGTYNTFAIEATDLALSSIGYVLLFLIRELENFKKIEA